MLRYRTGVAGSSAGGIAVAKYLTSETLKPENDALARYYAGESVPEQALTGMEALGRAVAQGDTLYSDAVNELTRAHMRLFGMPEDLEGLEKRVSDQLLSAIDRVEKRESIAADGGTVAGIRADLNPELAKRLGIDTNGPPSVSEIANLLTGLRADGQAIEGKQVHKPMRSVAAVFGLDEKAMPSPEAVAHVLAGRRADGEQPVDANGRVLPDEVVQGARKRFLAAYDMPAGQDPTPEQIAHIQAGRTVNGLNANPADVLWKLSATRSPIAFVDMVWSTDKSVSVAWALAPTEAERSVIKQAHDDAVAFAMGHAETHLGWATKGKNGAGGTERGSLAWLTFNHYTSRPTAEIARTDKDGNAYTEFQEVPIRVADPNLHTHAPLLNAVFTESGRVGSMDLDRLDGLVKELGGVYQARLARNLRSHGIEAALDKETGAARITAIPESVRDHFSKRSRDIHEAARKLAKEGGQDWDSLKPEHQLALLRRGVEETRLRKHTRDGASDFEEWRKQAEVEIGYQHRSVLRPDDRKQELAPEQRHRLAYETSLDLIEDALSKRASLNSQDFREFAVRGLVQAGISDNPERDIRAVMRMYRQHGVRQDGETVALVFGRDVPVRGKQRWSVTTEAHEIGERRVVELAQQAAADRSRSLPAEALERAKREFLAARPHIDPSGDSWREQSAAIDRLGTGGRLGVAIGGAGVGKTTFASVIVAAAKAEGRDVHGIAIAWKQATALGDAGIDRSNQAAIAAFINRAQRGKIALGENSTVIIDELSLVGRRQMQQLLELQHKHGFTLYAIGDPKQAQSIEAGGVIDLLHKALGNGIPEVLISNRQRSEREREIARLFRDGQAGQALAMKREDGTAELVPGGRDATIARVAVLWRERTEARRNDPDFQITISAPTNADAHAIGLAVREQMRDMGRLGPDAFTLTATMRGNGEQPMHLAEGDQVRLFNRVLADRQHFASNGDVVTVLEASGQGMRARNADGAEAFIAWDQLREQRGTPVRLAYGYGLTVDASQGLTSDEHIHALPDGSKMTHGLKGYVAESRHRDSAWLVVSEAAERRQVASRTPIGEMPKLQPDDLWRNVAANLARQPIKDTATDMLQRASEIARGSRIALPAALHRAEQRQARGEAPAYPQRQERQAAERSPDLRRDVHDMRHRMTRAQALERAPERAQTRGPSLSL